jgi:hypothetical protein
VTPVRAYLHTTIAAIAVAFGALSAPANATVSTPFGSINAGGFGVVCFRDPCPTQFGLSNQQALSVSTPFGGFSGPGFGISFGPFGGNFGGFGLGNAGPGAGGYYTGFGVSTPWGGVSTPFFGLNEQQALSVRTPWGGASMPGFGIGMPCGFVGPCMPHPLGFGVGSPQQALSVSTPFGGFYGPGFGISTPWGGMNMGGFGVGAQQPQVMPIYWPNPY